MKTAWLYGKIGVWGDGKNMRITMKCHHPDCKKRINEGMASLSWPFWFFCTEHQNLYEGTTYCGRDAFRLKEAN